MSIRLSGTVDELKKAIAIIKNEFTVIQISDFYQNRGSNTIYRVYIRVEFKE